MKTLIIVPVYNEQEIIAETIDKLIKFIEEYINYDFLIVDDCSTDNSRAIIKQVTTKYLFHPINIGIGEPFKTGIDYGINNGFTKFVNFDSDGQHNLNSLLELEKSNADYVVGSRFLQGKRNISIRNFGSILLTTAIYLRCGKKITDSTSGLVLVNNIDLAKLFIRYGDNRPEPSMYPKIVDNWTVEEVAVLMNKRETGISHFNVYSSMHFMLEQIFIIILKG